MLIYFRISFSEIDHLFKIENAQISIFVLFYVAHKLHRNDKV